MSGTGNRTKGPLGSPDGPASGLPLRAVPRSSASSAHPDEAIPARYDEDLFLIGGRETGPGEVSRQDFRLHEQYVAWAKRIVESGKFPISTRSDIWRLGAIIALRWLDSLEPDIVERSVNSRLAHIETTVAWERRRVGFLKSIDKMSDMINEIVQLPHGKVQAARILRKMRADINAMEHGFHRATYERMFNDRFAHLEQLAGGVTLIESSDKHEDAALSPDEPGASPIDMAATEEWLIAQAEALLNGLVDLEDEPVE